MRRALAVMVLGALVGPVLAAGCADDTGVETRDADGTESDVSDGAGPSSTAANTVSSAPLTTGTAPATTVTTTTSVPAESSTTAAPATVAPTAPPTVAPTSPPADVPAGLPLSGSGTAWIQGSEEGDPEVGAAAGECAAFYAAIAAGPYTVSECGVWNAVGGTRVWTVTRGGSGRFFGIVWQESAPGNWIPLLRVLEPAAGTWDDLNLVTGNIDTGPNDELVAGTRLSGSGGYLTVEIIDIRSGAPRVVARVPELHHGRAVLATEGVYVYDAGFDEPECCPATLSQNLMASTPDGWVLAEGFAGAPIDSVPASDL